MSPVQLKLLTTSEVIFTPRNILPSLNDWDLTSHTGLIGGYPDRVICAPTVSGWDALGAFRMERNAIPILSENPRGLTAASPFMDASKRVYIPCPLGQDPSELH